MISRRSLLRTLALSPLAALLGVKQPEPPPGRYLIARKVGADLVRQRETEIDAYTNAMISMLPPVIRVVSVFPRISVSSIRIRDKVS